MTTLVGRVLEASDAYTAPSALSAGPLSKIMGGADFWGSYPARA
jgi:hypothetical protein